MERDAFTALDRLTKNSQTGAAEPEDGGQGRGGVRSIIRALDLLGCFSMETRTISLTQAAKAVDLPVSTVSRLLGTLEDAGFVRRSVDGRYAPGGDLLRIGVMALHGVELYELAEDHLGRLARETGETANLAVLRGELHALYIRQIQSSHSIRHDNWIGRSVPVRGTAIGDALTGRLNQQGYSFTNMTLEPDVTVVAAPVYGADGLIAAALSVTAPTYRVDEKFIDRTANLVVREARAMSSSLGAPTYSGART